MSWRDFIVSSQILPVTPSAVIEGDCVDIVDSVLNKEKKSSSSYMEKNPQILNPQNTSTKTTKHPDGVPAAPLQPGWLVVYRDRDYLLCGGCDDRTHGTVQTCQWNGHTWMVVLTDGQQLPLMAIRSVGMTDTSGRVVSAWTVREHGYNGEERAYIRTRVQLLSGRQDNLK